MEIDEAESIFLQGDIRYDSFFSKKLIEFFNENALKIIKEDISDINIANINLEEIDGPQKKQKAIATKILLSSGFKLIDYEKDIGWGKVDVLGQNTQNKFIAIECGPCRLTKVIDYFRWDEVEELWLVSIYYRDEKLYIIKRGPNWGRKIEEFDKEKLENLRKVGSSLDLR